jgi:hypothetical protein
MISTDSIISEQGLADILTSCGFPSQEPQLAATWEYFSLIHSPDYARHLTGDTTKMLFACIENGKLKIYNWLVLACEIRGQISEELLKEKIKLCADPNKAPSHLDNCICLALPLPFDHYQEERFVGQDDTNGRFSDIHTKYCRHCRRIWLHYFVEYENYSRSGRYFMGVITPEMESIVTAETAVSMLEQLDWHLYGGSYFGKSGKSTDKHLQVD